MNKDKGKDKNKKESRTRNQEETKEERQKTSCSTGKDFPLGRCSTEAIRLDSSLASREKWTRYSLFSMERSSFVAW